jgi:hypothetical protein
MPDPHFVALTGIEAAKDASSVKVSMRDRGGQFMTFEITKQAAEDLIGALRLELGRTLAISGQQENVQFVVTGTAAGTATALSGQKHPTIELKLDGGGTLYLVIPQLLFDALHAQMTPLVSHSASGKAH